MNLLIDLRGCHFHQERGIPNYAQLLARSIGHLREGPVSFLVHKDRPVLARLDQLTALGKVHYFEDLHLSNFDGIDTFLLTSVMHGMHGEGESEIYTIPPPVAAQRPVICAILYDLIPLIFEDVYLTHGNARSYRKALSVLKHCDHLFAISESSSRDATNLIGIPPHKITTLWCGLDEEKWRADAQLTRSSRDVAYIGGEDFRKNMERTVRAFGAHKRRSQNSQLRLNIVCNLSQTGQRRLNDIIAEEQLDPSCITLTGLLSDNKIVETVATARATIFPSLYEGLGLPILESYAVGTPVFGSNNSSVADLVCELSQFDPRSVDAIAGAFDKIAFDPEALAASAEFGRQLLPRFSWQRGAIICVKIMKVLLRLQQKEQVVSRGVALVGPLAPEETGVGAYNTKAFVHCSTPITIFTEAADETALVKKWDQLRRHDPDGKIKLGPVWQFPQTVTEGRYKAAVFVIGNSNHSIPAVREAMRFKAHSSGGPIKILYLHEARVTGLLYAYFGEDINLLGSRLREYYPEMNSWRF